MTVRCFAVGFALILGGLLSASATAQTPAAISYGSIASVETPLLCLANTAPYKSLSCTPIYAIQNTAPTPIADTPAGLCVQTYPSVTTTFSEAFLQFGSQERDCIFTDYGNLYNKNNVKNFGLVLLGAGVLANTKLDDNFQAWHSRRVHSDFSREISRFSQVFGNGYIFVPIVSATALTYRFFQTRHGLPACQLEEFTHRTMRGYLVGFPTLLAMQVVLGGDRPRSGMGSHWHPFRQNHGVSGHAFMGAVPFITAAHMTDKPWATGLFYAMSVFPAWSRVHDDAHNLSQVLLGWYLAYLSVRAVSVTEEMNILPRGLTIFPVAETQSVGVGLFYQF
jgi:hypothetical protein